MQRSPLLALLGLLSVVTSCAQSFGQAPSLRLVTPSEADLVTAIDAIASDAMRDRTRSARRGSAWGAMALV